MASEIARERVFGNFKPQKGARAKAKKAKKPAAERRDGMDDGHLKYIRAMPCCACLGGMKEGGVEAHHLKQGTGERGMGLRSTDKWAVPLCREHHDEVERAGSRNEGKVFASWGIDDPLQLAADLWRARSSLPHMVRVLYGHKLIGRE